MPMMVTCKVCKTRDVAEKFKDGCPKEGCVMGRRRGRGGNKHMANCLCSRCLDADVSKLEEQLEAQAAKHLNDGNMQMAQIHLSVRESPVIGPYDGADLGEALYVTCPMAIVGTIVPRSRRRK